VNKWVRELSVLRRAFFIASRFSRFETTEAGGNSMDNVENFEDVERDLIKIFSEAGMSVTKLQNPLYSDATTDIEALHTITLDEPEIDMLISDQEDY
jgi:hypothetical protein